MQREEYEIMARVESDHWWYRGMRRIAGALLDAPALRAQRTASKTPWRVLDAGCGTGGNAVHLLGRYGQVYGLDISPLAAQISAERLPGAIQRGSVLQLPYGDACFDLVTSFEVLYHRAVPDEAVALREICRVLRPGGWLLLRLPAYDWLRRQHDVAVHTRRRYRRSEVEALVERAGFRAVRSSYANSVLFPVLLLQWLVEQVRPAQEHESDLAPPHPLVNRLLELPLTLEAAWLRRGGALPAGLSAICLARKPELGSVL